MRRMNKLIMLYAITCSICLLGQGGPKAWGDDTYVVYQGGDGPGQDRHVVLISGDEEYRSEEMMPQLGKILSTHHGFRCTVLFAVVPDSGMIDPNHVTNIPGLAALADADLMILFTRFRNLPDDQMQHVDQYLKSGKPVIGIRTATHAFKLKQSSPWNHYSDGYGGEQKAWKDGFGRLVLGEKWLRHHGHHKHESTRGIIAPDAQAHPIVRGIKNGAVWGPTDVYGVRLPLPGDSSPVLLGEVLKRAGEFDSADIHFGMKPGDPVLQDGKKNDPMMPIAWTKSYQLPGGKQGKAFVSTIGAATDFVSEGTRRLLVNSVYWALEMTDQLGDEGANVDLVGEYKPSAYGFHDDKHWKERNLYPADFKLNAN